MAGRTLIGLASNNIVCILQTAGRELVSRNAGCLRLRQSIAPLGELAHNTCRRRPVPCRQNRLYGSACTNVDEWLGTNGGSDVVRVLLTLCFADSVVTREWRSEAAEASLSMASFLFRCFPQLHTEIKRGPRPDRPTCRK